MIKAVVFDAFDTIVHYKKHPTTNRKGAYALLLENTGFDIKHQKEWINKLMTTNKLFFEVVAIINEQYGNLPPLRRDEIRQILDEELASMAFYQDVTPTIQSLKRKGYKIGLLSNLATPYGEKLRGSLNDFDEITFSYEIGHKKPEPQSYKIITEKLGVALHEALMIGNHPKHDFSGAKEVGMQSLLLDRNNIEISIPQSQKIQTLEELLKIL